MREIITICVGGAGVRIGAKFWELLCLEHGIAPNGRPNPGFSRNSGDSRSSFFNETASGKLVPRTIFVDLEPTAVDKVSKDLFHPDSFISGNEGACGNFARGYCTAGKEIIDLTLDRIRRLTDACDSFQGFLIINSVGGGTGSGFTTLLMERLTVEYGKKSKVQFAIYPTNQLSTAITEPYNAVLSTHYTFDHSDCCFLVDNDAIYDIAQKSLGIATPSYADLNCLIAHAIANVTASLRFQGSLNTDLNEFQANLVPVPRMHFPVISHAPIVSRENATHSELNTLEITNAVFDPKNQLVKCDPRTGKYMSSCLLYRGDVTLRDANAAIAQLKSRPDISFVAFCPISFKAAIINHPQVSFPDDLMAPAKRSVTMLSNTTATVSVFSKLAHKFDLMYAKRAFVHWYVSEGLEEGEFQEAREGLASLIEEYEKVAFGSSNDK